MAKANSQSGSVGAIRDSQIKIFGIEDPQIEKLVQTGLDIAKSTGASYADVRVTHTRSRDAGTSSLSDTESLIVGIRVLWDGYWGFACSPICTTDEVQRIAKEAVAIAKTNAKGKRRVVELAPSPLKERKHWKMPVRLNPFDISPDEIQDYLVSLGTFVERSPRVEILKNQCMFSECGKAFGSTEGGFYTQTLYMSKGDFIFRYTQDNKKGIGAIDLLSPTGVGWELYRDQPIREAFAQELEEIKFDMSLPIKPVEVGRFDAVLDAQGVAHLLAPTIGEATQLTRAMGYNANDKGTSYVTDPVEMLGTFSIGNQLLNVSANRSEAGGVATVQWDDEGVAPVTTQLVKEGIVSGYSTTRESATWLKSPAMSREQPPQSSGSAFAASAVDVPTTIHGNLQMSPGSSSDDFLSLIAGMKRGVAFRRMEANMDFQCLNGLGIGKAYEIRDGKRVSLLLKAAVLFKTPELWKSVTHIGGATGARRFNGVTAVPLMVREISVIDLLRKA